MEDLLERVIAIAQAFGRTEIPHSFGGAIVGSNTASAQQLTRALAQRSLLPDP